MTLKLKNTALQPRFTLVAMLCLASSASAAIDQTAHFSSTPASLTFNQFNPSLGTLNSVSITIETVVQAVIPIEIMGYLPSMAGDFTTTIPFTVTLPIQIQGPDSVIYGTKNTVTIPGGQIKLDANYNITQQSAKVSATFAPICVSSYVGTGSYTLTIQTAGDPFVSCPEGFFTIAQSFVKINGVNNSLKVSYEYESKMIPVPESSTYFAGIGALAMFCFMEKFRCVCS